MKKLILGSIRFYQRFISPDTSFLKAFFPRGVCRFSPTCSTYFYEAVNRYGIIRGTRLGVARLLRCHPLSPGGHDPVPIHLKTK